MRRGFVPGTNRRGRGTARHRIIGGRSDRAGAAFGGIDKTAIATDETNAADWLRVFAKKEQCPRVRSAKQARAARFPALSRSSLLRAADSRPFFPSALRQFLDVNVLE